ncbi:MAG: MoaD/ThiS family protein [Candidatus Eiseniibacteriota bacterium]
MIANTVTKEAEVTLSVFGAERRRARVSEPSMTIGDVLRGHGVEPGEHRLARNGNPATATEPVREGDELTVVPRIQGG